jgi:hypothetical protein
VKTGKARYTPLFLSKADLDVALDNADGQRCVAYCCGIQDPLIFGSLRRPHCCTQHSAPVVAVSQACITIAAGRRWSRPLVVPPQAVVLLPLQAGDGAGSQRGEGDARAAGAGGGPSGGVVCVAGLRRHHKLPLHVKPFHEHVPFWAEPPGYGTVKGMPLRMLWGRL